MERDGSSDTVENLVDMSAENEKARKSRNGRREPARRGWLEFDLVRVHGRSSCLFRMAARAYRGRRADKPSARTVPRTVTPSAGRWLRGMGD